MIDLRRNRFILSFRSELHNLLSRGEAKLPLAVFGIAVGIVAGMVVNLFRFILEQTFPLLGDGLHHDDFEALPPTLLFFLPIAGCLVIGLLLHYLTPELRRMGVSYVIDKVQHFRSRMPLKNALMQFITAALALLSGGSCGREGPAIHLGASAGGIIGQALVLPNNSIRNLIASGSAAAISAAFNTPIAGVIFAMEVILMEYAVTGIIPVIVASVSGVVVTQIFYGDQPVFMIEAVAMNSLWQIPWVALMGLLTGALASLFVTIHKRAVDIPLQDIRVRLLIVGLLTGGVGVFIPEIMGMGYDSLNQALQGNLALDFLLVLLAAKFLVTAISLGLGLPGGVIGPSLMLGGLAGAIMGIIGENLIPGSLSSTSFYVLIGMCAMMGALLQAPLAALMALLELSDNPNIILPAMIIIVVANLSCSELFRTGSVFRNTLPPKRTAFSPELSRFLSRFGVSTVVRYKIARLQPDADRETLQQALAGNPEFVVINYEGDKKALVNPNVLYMAKGEAGFDLQSLDKVQEIVPVSMHATLAEALEILTENDTEFGYVTTRTNEISGVVSQGDIIAFYKGS